MVDIGKRIKAARQKAGMSQEELAQAIGSTKSAVSRYEAGKRQPRYDQLLNIADALGVSVHTLVDWGDVDEEAFKELFIYGEGPAQPEVVVHEEPIDKTEVEVHELPAQELETLMAKLQDGKPLVLSPDDLAKIKATPKEQIAAALDKVGQEEQKQIVRINAPLYKLRGVSPERRERVEKLKDQAVRYEHSLGITGLGKSTMIGALLAKDPQRRIAAALDKLNKEGQEKVATYAEDLVEMPKYQAQEPPTTPAQTTPMPQDGTDTAPAETPPDGPQEPPEGRIQSITMICPICGQHLRGDTSTGKAYCNYCKRSFPLPQILK